MSLYSSVSILSAVLIGCAAAPADAQLFEIKHEADLDALASFGDAEGVVEGLHLDLRLRAKAEAITESGLRWGGAVSLAARNRDGRRGLQSGSSSATGPAGLVTGLGGAGVDDVAVAGFQGVEVFLRSTLVEVHVGIGETAARRERLQWASALRLTGADGALIDPLGRGLVDTGVTLSAPAPQITLRTRRLIGFAFAASYTPEGDACGPDRCLDVRYGEVERIASAAVTFDRRVPSSGARWSAFAGLERGQATPGPLSNALSDPWLASVQLGREAGGLAVSVSGVHAEEGVADAQYSAISARISFERNDWLFDAEIGRAFSDLADRDGVSAQLGASRFVGAQGVAGAAVQLQSDGGPALVLEAGLRF